MFIRELEAGEQEEKHGAVGDGMEEFAKLMEPGVVLVLDLKM